MGNKKKIMEHETKPTGSEKQMEAINSGGLCPLLIQIIFEHFNEIKRSGGVMCDG